MNDCSTVLGLLKDHHENKELMYENLLKFYQLRSAMLDGQASLAFKKERENLD